MQEVRRVCTLSVIPWFCNKWYVAKDPKLKWIKVQRAKKTCIMAHMVSASEKVCQGVKPEVGRRWKPGSVVVVKNIKEMLDVKGKLEESLLG
eukprot:6898160-Ditylum_brightwellii.AAC.1